MSEDTELLRRFVEQSSETAFRDLVQRRIDFVYGAALRQVGGDAHLAQDVTQTVFLDLARKARVLVLRSDLTGWLYTSTRFAASKALRSRARRNQHETEAHAMNEVLSASSADELKWSDLRPVLDETMHELSETDREAILLRFFEAQPLAEVGAKLGLSENSVRMRVDRALEKLRGRLQRRGITSTAAALGAVLSTQPAIAAPAGLAGSVAGFSLAGAATAGSGIATALWVFQLMNITKLSIGMVGVLAGIGVGALLVAQYQPKAEKAAEPTQAGMQSSIAALKEENRRLATEVARLQAERASREAAVETSALTAAAPQAAKLDQLRVLAELQNRRLVSFRITFVSPAGKLSPAFVELFALTPAEQDALQKTVDHSREKLLELERANSTVTRDEKGNIVVAVGPFAAAGGAVYDELMKSFAERLGAERNAAYLALGAEQVEESLAGFGATERIVTFTYNPAPENQQPYSIRDDRKDPQGHTVHNLRFRTFQEMANRAGTVSGLLPPDFGDKK